MACGLIKTPVTSIPELFALRDGLSALSVNLFITIGAHKSLLCVLRLDIGVVSPVQSKTMTLNFHDAYLI